MTACSGKTFNTVHKFHSHLHDSSKHIHHFGLNRRMPLLFAYLRAAATKTNQLKQLEMIQRIAFFALFSPFRRPEK